jgi:glycosyltransferase involved in cell wall biosynthesis
LIKYLGYLDKFLLFPPRLRRVAKTCDLVHIVDHSNSMYLRTVRGKPTLITCHDVLAIRGAQGQFPQCPTGWSGKLLQRWILSGLRRARHVLCVSAKTAADLKTLTGETGAQIRVVHNALTWNYRPGAALPEVLNSRLGLPPGQPYFLHVGGNQWYKNRAGVLRIFARVAAMDEFSRAILVMAGKPLPPALLDVIREERLNGRVIQAPGVTNEELQALYGNALALLFPSLEEGFGWPIVEAQACGCPVITSGRPPMSEVAGEAAIFIDPTDPEAAAAAVVAGLERRERLRDAGLCNVKRFDEETIANQYFAFYEEILAEEPISAP